jgi:hypothetical protein
MKWNCLDAETKLCEKHADDSTSTLTKEFNSYILNKEEQRTITNYNNTNTHTWKIGKYIIVEYFTVYKDIYEDKTFLTTFHVQ